MCSYATIKTKGMKTFRLIFLFVIASSFLSCRKSGSDDPIPDAKPQKLVKKVSSSPSNFVSYEYDASGNVLSYISQWENGPGELNKLTNVYEYSGGKLMKASNEAGYGLFSYRDNVLEKAEHFLSNNRKLSTLIYKFNNGKLIELIEQIANPQPDGAKETKVSYQYYNNGNVSRVDFAHRKELSDPFTVNFSKVFVAYDDKKNPEPDGIIGFFVPGVVLHINNPVRVDNILPDGSVDGYSRYEYSYNSSGFPTERKQFIATRGIEQSPLVFHYTY